MTGEFSPRRHGGVSMRGKGKTSLVQSDETDLYAWTGPSFAFLQLREGWAIHSLDVPAIKVPYQWINML